LSVGHQFPVITLNAYKTIANSCRFRSGPLCQSISSSARGVHKHEPLKSTWKLVSRNILPQTAKTIQSCFRGEKYN
jgi:hypothetical protein